MKVSATKVLLDAGLLIDDGNGNITVNLDAELEDGGLGLRLVANSVALSKMADEANLLLRNVAENVSGQWDFDTPPTVGGAGNPDNQAATKGELNAVVAGLNTKANCEAATAIDLATDTGTTWAYDNGTAGVGATLTSDTNGNYNVDGFVGLTAGDRVLIKDDGIWNGVYEVTQDGDGSNPMILTRASDFDGSPTDEIGKGDYTFVTGGVVNAGKGYSVTSADNPTLGADTITWAVFISRLSASEVKSLYESNADTNAFTDAEQTKLTNLEIRSASDIKTLYESNADTNAFTDAEQTKLTGVEDGAQANISLSDTVTTTPYVLQASDAFRTKYMDSVSAQEFQIPQDLDEVNFPINASVDVIQVNTGQTTFAEQGTVSVIAISDQRAISAKGGAATLRRKASNEYILIGSLS